jgi:hypothetical protein
VQWPCPGRFRPFGYNPVELSRFAVGAFPLIFQSPTRLAREGSSPTLSPFGNALTRILPSQGLFHNHSRHPDFGEFRRLFRLGAGILRSVSRDGRLGNPRVTASFTLGYELSKPTDNPAPV